MKSFLMLMSFLAASSAYADSPIGHWVEDPQGLPAYVLKAPLPIETKASDGTPFPLREDPLFLLGNYRLTLFVHGSGIVQVVTGERVWARLNAAGNSYGSNTSTLHVESPTHKASYSLTGLQSLAANPARCQRVFGTGFAQFLYTLEDGLHVERTLSVAPSAKVNEGLPGFLLSVTLRNEGTQPLHLGLEEAIQANYEAMFDRLTPKDKRLVRYQQSAKISKKDLVVRNDVTAESADATVLRGRDEPSRYDSFPPSLVLQLLSAPNAGEVAEMFAEPQPGGVQSIGGRLTTTLKPGEAKTSTWLVSIVPQNEEDVVTKLAKSMDFTKPAPYFREEWKRQLPDLSAEKDPVWRREMTWHSYVLEAMANYSEYYHETFIPQGETYDYEMGMTAAPRDQLQHSLPLCYTNPALAKSTIRYILKKMTKLGEIPYLSNGYGMTGNSAWNTSDQQLYLFLAVGEYLRITGDYGFLNERTEYLPQESTYGGSTLERLERAFSYLRDEVGHGSHGLVRLMNSDWSDMIYSDTPLFRHFFSAESHMNSAMVLAVMPTLIDQLNKALEQPGRCADPLKARQLIQGMNRYLGALRTAFYTDLGNATYSKRLYFDAAHSWGADTMHIEPQSYLLLAPDFAPQRKKELWAAVQTRLLKDEQIGARQREEPIQNAMYQAGTGENGGVWFALVGPMIAGVGTFDKQAAWAQLRQLSMDEFARKFPNYWVGQWTAAECFNSVTTGPIAGLPRTGDNWTWTSFPVFCAHAHGWPLYCYYRLKTLP